MKLHLRWICLISIVFTSAIARAESPASKLLFDPAAPGAVDQVAPNDTLGNTTFVLKDSGIDVSVIANGKASFPGVRIKPPQPWDASAFGHVEAVITNNGTKPIRVTMRLDNGGPGQDARQNSSTVGIKPGETKTLSTVFGYTNGKRADALKSEAILQALIFIGKSDVPQSFRITSFQATGVVGEKPYVDPNTVAVKPAGGVILGNEASFDSAKQTVARNGAKVTATDAKSFSVNFSGAGQSVVIKPAAGMWNLNEQLQVRVRVRNTGSTSVTPRAQLTSRKGSTDEIPATKPIAPGEEAEVVVPFAATAPWRGVDLPEMRDSEAAGKGFAEHQPGTGTEFQSNNTTSVVLLADTTSGPSTLEVTSVIADMPPQQPLPDWLGKRPPVEGDWTLTFEDNFDGNTIDLKKWNIYTPRAWHLGKATGFSKDNVIVKDGKLTLRVEKRQVHHDDNPDYPLFPYATGWADSFGKWTQRYGYFEARVKLPTTPDSFTAFWLMPDRGIEFDPHQAPKIDGQSLWRNNTLAGGMEFDIMEHLSIWGRNRHNFAMHWDGYEKKHKVTGSGTNYYQPDADGFVTVGMAWTPGVVVLYQNGREAARWESARVGSLPSYLILQHITGGWETEGMDDSQLPADLVFDYVRVWQRKDLASAIDGPKPNDSGPLPPTKL